LIGSGSLARPVSSAVGIRQLPARAIEDDFSVSNHQEFNVPEALIEKLKTEIAKVEHPRELAVDVMMALQGHYGYLSDAARDTAADLLGMSALEVDELATFYTFIYREPVGRYVIHVCDSLICWLAGEENIVDHLRRVLAIDFGQTTADGLFTLLPVCCIGYCDRAPAILVNRRVHGPLTIEKLDALLEKYRTEAQKAR
jgi:NADH-quinone oxidoreductase subunit E